MARYNTIKIGNEYLTSNGLVGGKPCKTEVTGLDALLLPYGGNTVKACSGKPYLFLTALADSEGIDIRIQISIIPKARLDEIKEIIKAALDGDLSINVVLTGGDFGDFDLQCQPLFGPNIRPINTQGRFRNGYIYDVSFNFTVESVNPPEEPEP